MRLYGVTGWKNAGKTGLMERLVTEITGRGRVMELLVALAGVPREVIFQQPARFIRDLGGNAEAAALLSRHVAECSEGNSEEEATGA